MRRPVETRDTRDTRGRERVLIVAHLVEPTEEVPDTDAVLEDHGLALKHCMGETTPISR